MGTNAAVIALCAISLVFGALSATEIAGYRLNLGPRYDLWVEANKLNLSASCEPVQHGSLLMQPWSAISAWFPCIPLAYQWFKHRWAIDMSLGCLTLLAFWQQFLGGLLHAGWVDTKPLSQALTVGGICIFTLSIYDVSQFFNTSCLKRPSRSMTALLIACTAMLVYIFAVLILDGVERGLRSFFVQLTCYVVALTGHFLTATGGLRLEIRDSYVLVLCSQAFFPVAVLIVDGLLCELLTPHLGQWPLHVITHTITGLFNLALIKQMHMASSYGSRMAAVASSQRLHSE